MAAFAAAAIVAAAMLWCCKVVIDGDAVPAARGERKRPAKKFAKNLAEGVRVSRDGYEGVDFVKCGSCRLEKRKSGALTFGAFNVLVLEDLEVVAPPAGEDDGAASSPQDGDGVDVVRRMGISDAFLTSRRMPLRFSAVRISDFSLSRLAGSNRVERVVFAREAESGDGALSLSGCTLYAGGGEEKIRGAKIEKSGRGLRLVWKGGRLDL